VKRIYSIFIYLVTFCHVLSGQNNGHIYNPVISYKNNKLFIQYKINNNKNSDQYYVWPELIGANGEKIKVKTLNGDYGLVKDSKDSKQIVWDMGKDNVTLDEEITVQVKAEVLPRLFSKPAEMGLSVFLPGWGLSRIHKRKPYWLMGVAGYGCVTASVILNRQASKNYQLYLETDIKQESDRLFMQATQQDRLSESLAWTAAGIWAVNLLWVAVTSNHPKPSVDFQKWSLVPAISIYKQPVITLQYKF